MTVLQTQVSCLPSLPAAAQAIAAGVCLGVWGGVGAGAYGVHAPAVLHHANRAHVDALPSVWGVSTNSPAGACALHELPSPKLTKHLVIAVLTEGLVWVAEVYVLVSFCLDAAYCCLLG